MKSDAENSSTSPTGNSLETGQAGIPVETARDNGGENGGGLPVGIEPLKPKGKRGRPPGSKNSGTPLDTGASVAPKSGSSANANALQSAAFIGKGLVALVELAETFVHNAAASKIEKKYPSKIQEFKEMAQSVALTPKDADLMKECATAIALKYDVLTRFGPEVVLAVTLAQYSMRQITLLRFVEKVTTEKKAESLQTNN